MEEKLTPQQELEQVLAEEQALRDEGQQPGPGLILQRAELLNELRRFSESLTACEEALSSLRDEHGPKRVVLLVLLASNLIHTGKLTEAIIVSMQAEQICIDLGLPVDPRIHFNIGDSRSRMGKFEEALAAFAESERLAELQGLPVSESIAMGRGIIYTVLGRLEESLASYDEAESICIANNQPVNPAIFVNRGITYMFLGRYSEALADFDEAERQFLARDMPVFPGLFMSRGGVYVQLGRYEDALAAYDQAEEMCKSQDILVHPSIESNRAAAYGKLSRFEDSLAAFERAELMYSEQGVGADWNLYFSRAITMYEAGYREEAVDEAYRSIMLCGKLGIQQPAFVKETLKDWLSPKPEKLVEEQIASQPRAIEPVPDIEKKHDVFICYRRDLGKTQSMLLQAHMDLRGKSVFRDIDSLAGGHFEEALRDAIRYSRHMVILLTPDFLGRCCIDDNDVVRQEISTALHCGTHIIPVMMEGFSWPQPDELPEDIRGLCKINGMSWSDEFYTAFIDKLVSWME